MVVAWPRNTEGSRVGRPGAAFAPDEAVAAAVAGDEPVVTWELAVDPGVVADPTVAVLWEPTAVVWELVEPQAAARARTAATATAVEARRPELDEAW